MNAASPLKPVFWCLGVIVFLMALLFGAGLFYRSIIGKIETQLTTGPTVADVDKRLSKQIGRTYEQRNHDGIISIMDADAQVQASLLKSSKAFSIVVFQIAGAGTFLALLSCFHLIRRSQELRRPTDSSITPPTSEP